MGWRSAFEVFGWGSMAILLGCAATISRPPVLREKVKVDIVGKMRTRTFVLLYVALTFCGIAIYVAFVFIPAFAMDLGATHVAGAALIGYIGASSVVGRLGLNVLAERFGLIAMYKASYWILLAGCGVWTVSHSYPALVVFALVMGVGYGGIAAMTPAVAAQRFGIEGLGEVLGFLMTSFGVACLVGPPLAGVLVDSTHDFRWPAFVAVASAVVALGAVQMLRAKRKRRECNRRRSRVRLGLGRRQTNEGRAARIQYSATMSKSVSDANIQNMAIACFVRVIDRRRSSAVGDVASAFAAC